MSSPTRQRLVWRHRAIPPDDPGHIARRGIHPWNAWTDAETHMKMAPRFSDGALGDIPSSLATIRVVLIGGSNDTLIGGLAPILRIRSNQHSRQFDRRTSSKPDTITFSSINLVANFAQRRAVTVLAQVVADTVITHDAADTITCRYLSLSPATRAIFFSCEGSLPPTSNYRGSSCAAWHEMSCLRSWCMPLPAPSSPHETLPITSSTIPNLRSARAGNLIIS